MTTTALSATTVAESLTACGFEIRAQIVWAKDRLVLGRGHYHWQHEPAWYARKPGARLAWIGQGFLGLLAFLLVLGVVVRQGKGVLGAVALLTAFMPFMTLTVFFEPTWWFAAGLLLGGKAEAQDGQPGSVGSSSTEAFGEVGSHYFGGEKNEQFRIFGQTITRFKKPS